MSQVFWLDVGLVLDDAPFLGGPPQPLAPLARTLRDYSAS